MESSIRSSHLAWLSQAFSRPVIKQHGRWLSVLCLTLVISACGGGGSGSDSGDDSALNSDSPPSDATRTVSLSESPSNAGSVTGDGAYDEGTVVTVTASANDGYVFVNWTENGVEVSASPRYQVTVDHSMNLVANFKQGQNVVEINPPPVGIVASFEAAHAAPGVVFAATAEAVFGDGNNGLWRSTDSGANWTKVLSGDVTFVTVASGDSDLVLAGLGASYQISTDGGATWSAGTIKDSIFGDPVTFEDGDAVTATDGIYLSTRNGIVPGLFKSTDLGVSWSYVLTESISANSSDSLLKSVVVSPSRPDTLYAATGFDSNLWKSSDAGGSFLSIKNGLTTEPFIFEDGVAVDPFNADHILVRNNLSVNGGANWSQVADITPRTTFWLDGDLVRFGTSVGDGTFEVSRDNGATWITAMSLSGPANSTVISTRRVYVAKDAIYLEEDNSSTVSDRLYKVDLSLLRDHLNSI